MVGMYKKYILLADTGGRRPSADWATQNLECQSPSRLPLRHFAAVDVFGRAGSIDSRISKISQPVAQGGGIDRTIGKHPKWSGSF
ncbi:MAG: hypothetical protein Kow0060_03200 [Methylohalobius crimeensis]